MEWMNMVMGFNLGCIIVAAVFYWNGRSPVMKWWGLANLVSILIFWGLK